MRPMIAVATIALLIPAALFAMIWIGMLYDISVTRKATWEAAGHDRTFCLLLLFALGPVGAILYGLAVRPHLARIEFEDHGYEPKRADKWAA